MNDVLTYKGRAGTRWQAMMIAISLTSTAFAVYTGLLIAHLVSEVVWQFIAGSWVTTINSGLLFYHASESFTKHVAAQIEVKSDVHDPT